MRSPRSKPIVSCCCLKISLLFLATVIIFFTAGLLSLVLRARRLLGAYRIPMETGLLIPSDKLTRHRQLFQANVTLGIKRAIDRKRNAWPELNFKHFAIVIMGDECANVLESSFTRSPINLVEVADSRAVINDRHHWIP